LGKWVPPLWVLVSRECLAWVLLLCLGIIQKPLCRSVF
jgi:hypothetical protein